MICRWMLVPLLLAGSIGNPVAAESPLTFAEAMNRLASQNEHLAAERQVLNQNRQELDAAQGRRWPELGISGGYFVMENDISISLPTLPPPLTGALPDNITLQQREFISTAATVKWPLYTGGRITAGIDAARAGLAAGQAQLDGVEASLYQTLVERYFGQVLASHAYQLKTTTVDTLADHLLQAQRLQAQGQIARAEVLRAEVALSQARVEQASARHQLALTRAALAALLASTTDFQTTTPLPDTPAFPPLESLLLQAEQHNPNLRAAREQRLRAEAGVKAARGEQLPSLALFGRHKLYDRDLDLASSDWVAGVMLDWTLFDGGIHRHKVGAAQARADEVAYRVRAGHRDVELLVRQRHNQLADALSRINAFGAMQALAEESLRAQRRAFEEGLASSLDVVDAELALQKVELGLLAARYDSLIAASGLLEATGQTGRLNERFAIGNAP